MKHTCSLFILLAIFLLTACGGTQPQPEILEYCCTFDGGDAPAPKNIRLPLPDGAVETFSDGSSVLYTAGDESFRLITETLQADSLDSLVQELSGRPADALTVMTTLAGNYYRHDLSWTCTGETGLETCLCAILDDGTYYYAVSAFCDEGCSEDCRDLIEFCMRRIDLEDKTYISPEILDRDGTNS